MRLAVTALTVLCLLAHPATAQICETQLIPSPATAVAARTAPVINVPPQTAPTYNHCDIEPAGGPPEPPPDPPPEEPPPEEPPPPPPPPPPPANCPAQNVSWKVLLITYNAPLAALNHGQTGRASVNILFVGLCSADFTCTNGTVAQTGGGFCL